jgi:hypothetical protein
MPHPWAGEGAGDRSWSQSIRDSSRGVHEELLAQDKYKDPRNLNRYGAKIYSQAGEDGIIAEIFGRIGTASKDFLISRALGNPRRP